MLSNFSEAQSLADVFISSRNLTKYYLHKVKDADKKKRFSIGEWNTNSIHWIVSHLAWAENYLILDAVIGRKETVPWFQYFEIGSPYPEESKFPSYEEAVNTLDWIHEKSIAEIRNLSNQQLDEKNFAGIDFRDGDSKRKIIHHAIRHEGTHCGHLSWLAKLHGLKGR
ncbi:MAG TPA: hypothetical protein DCQ93_06670 [Bacteroidetes bacterium]|nr:hypothetical protein [Bacteroidota bacterium]